MCVCMCMWVDSNEVYLLVYSFIKPNKGQYFLLPEVLVLRVMKSFSALGSENSLLELSTSPLH